VQPLNDLQNKDRLILFTRYPEPGVTKTRLMPPLGPCGAAEIHRRLAEEAWRTLKSFAAFKNAEAWICHEGGTDKEIERWLGPASGISNQGGSNIGRRMENAFRDAFQSGCGRVIIVGSDIPDITHEHLRCAFDALMSFDLVLGPSRDGGYWLIGLNKPDTLFDNIPWGSKSVFKETIRKAESRGLKFALLESLADIDTVEDLQGWRSDWAERRPYISVIIPALNESKHIRAAVDSAKDPEAEIIVVDGGSKDDTAEQAQKAGAYVIEFPKGRASQLNRGAAAARGHVLLFLHADTLLPQGYLAFVFDNLLDTKDVMGAFRLKTDQKGPMMRLVEICTQLRARFLKRPYGDQGLFLRKSLFEAQGAFPTVALGEDFFFVRRFAKKGNIRIANAHVLTSARRWEDLGILRTSLVNQVVVSGFWLGISNRTLYRIYHRPPSKI
jgi:rSAM/selenodomain-associated transferase 2/rSAM/selenodomain-associated transferase 1